MNAGPSEDRTRGVFLGTAIGDALGLPFEGLSAATIRRRRKTLDRYWLLGRTGFVSDDTQLTVLLAESLLKGAGDLPSTLFAFRRSLKLWMLQLPWGAGAATLKACLLLWLGVHRSGRPSAGNGAAMRAAPLGAYFPDNREKRLVFGSALAAVTHRDPRAIDGALFVAELTAACLQATRGEASRGDLVRFALEVVQDSSLRTVLSQVMEGGFTQSSGFVLHSLGTAVTHFLQEGDQPLRALQACIEWGGDTDSNAAILGAWLGALHGAETLPVALIENLQGGAFGRQHLERLADALHRKSAVPLYSQLEAGARSLALFPVILGHGFRRLLPF